MPRTSQYVWGPEQVKHLLSSIRANFDAWQREKSAPSWQLVPGTSSSDVELQSLRDDFAAFHAKRTRATNVGFVYAYCDADLPGQYFLIDGQQRLTTLYLTLLSVATRARELQDRFRARYCVHSAEQDRRDATVPTKLDYKVREHTAEFLRHCVHYLLGGGDASDLTKQSWYLNRLDHDRTVQNLAGNFETIQTLLDPVLSNVEPARFYEYLEELVQCWYFDTNESAQGEELYLYLNARGESIADNENLKAALLAQVASPAEKDHWGREWETWQDYFWGKRHRGLTGKAGNPNADRGFNSFLRCIEYLENLRARREAAASPISLEIIAKYSSILRWLEEQKEQFKAPYAYAGWVEKWFDDVWGTFNQPDGVDWKATPGDNTKSSDHNRMVLMWGSLLCVVCALEREQDDWDRLEWEKIFRAIRVFYVRFRNFGRSVAALVQHARGLLADDPAVLGKEEEAAKWEFLKDRPDAQRRELESVIWEIEDHPFNADGGRGLGDINLTHLVNLAAEPAPTLAELAKIRDTFYDLFPLADGTSGESARNKKLASALLYYGVFWHRVNPLYYDNYDLGNWLRTIRGEGSAEAKEGNSTIFRRFFDEFLHAGRSLDEFLEQKRRSVTVDPKAETDLRNVLIWYSEKLKARFFEKGMHIAIYGEQADAHFANFCALWNTKGDFRGNAGNQRIADLVEESGQIV